MVTLVNSLQQEFLRRTCLSTAKEVLHIVLTACSCYVNVERMVVGVTFFTIEQKNGLVAALLSTIGRDRKTSVYHTTPREASKLYKRRCGWQQEPTGSMGK